LECLFRSNVGIPRARKSIQGDGSSPRRRSWHSFPGSLLSGTLSSYGASTVDRMGSGVHPFGLWTLECLVRSNVGIPRTLGLWAHKAIQGDGTMAGQTKVFHALPYTCSKFRKLGNGFSPCSTVSQRQPFVTRIHIVGITGGSNVRKKLMSQILEHIDEHAQTILVQRVQEHILFSANLMLEEKNFLCLCPCVCLLLQDLLQSCSLGREEESGRHVL